MLADSLRIEIGWTMDNKNGNYSPSTKCSCVKVSIYNWTSVLGAVGPNLYLFVLPKSNKMYYYYIVYILEFSKCKPNVCQMSMLQRLSLPIPFCFSTRCYLPPESSDLWWLLI